ncbi:MAG: C25 family cysteine peptidase [Ferruginibacter sp.]
MKKLLCSLLLLLTFAAKAQLNNSWIDYSKTYYKFKVGKTGLYRINQSTLSAAGLGTVPAEQFQLWRNGEQIRIFTSAASGVFTGSDFIEFWGKMNDGVADKNLYRVQDYQLCDSFSLHTDTSTYFLTANPLGGNLRYTSSINNVAGNVLPEEPYFMRTVNSAYKKQYNRGYAAIVGEYVYSSSYDMGEGWASDDAVPCCDLTKEFTGLNVYTAGPANSVSLYISAFGNALYTRNLRVKIFNTTIINDPMNYFAIVKKRVDNIPLSTLQSPDYVPIYMNGTGTDNRDRVVIGEMWLRYPARFNFNNERNFSFELPAAASGNYLVIDNFNTGSTAPILYSVNDGKRYVGDISVAGKVRFALPASADVARKFILVNQEAVNYSTVNTLTAKSFFNFSTASNQGDYLIISHPNLYNDGNNNNYVEQYRQYRASAAGGSFNAKIIPIDELNDQFAFGIKKHPAAIRDFTRFADQNFVTKPKYIFIIGRGMSSLEFRVNEAHPATDQIDLVQTFGWPASDNLLVCQPGQNVPITPIGRISVVNGGEIKKYLDKVKQYELAQSSTSQTIINKAWMKNAIHVVGGKDSLEDALFSTYLNGYKTILEDTSYGGRVETFKKATTAAVEQANGERIQDLMNNGIGFIGYFGHSSANTLAFNLSSPEIYSNAGKYPFFNVSGCSAGNFYIFDPTRLTGNLTLTEKYVLAEQRGSIGFLASTHLGIPPFLNFYNTQLYNAISKTMYGNSIGNQIKNVMQTLGGNPQTLDYYTRIHLEEVTLHGDPALKINAFALPDYAVEDQSVRISPSIISVADNNFNVKVKMNNIGKAVGDSIRVIIKRTLPSNAIQVLYNELIPSIKYADSLELIVSINPLTDKGLNKLTVTLDADFRQSELSENNNEIVKEFFIFEDEIRPVYPYNYSIVNQQNIVYSASTANPLSGQRQYLMEVDTTELFNSAFKKQYTASGLGGLIQFTPSNLTFTDSTVYYWRTSIVPLNNGTPIWNSFSFVYLANSSSGFNQSHYYQHKKSSFSNTISLDNDRVMRFKELPQSILIRTGLYPYISYDRINVNLDFDQLEYYGCKYESLQFLVYDTATLLPWKNFNTAGSGRYGSWPVCDVYPGGYRYIFEFPYSSPAYRKKAMDFMDSIPDGMYVSVTNLGWTNNTSFISDWQADQGSLGAGNSLYHKLKAAGFSKIDSFTRNLPFIFFYRKNRNGTFTPVQKMGDREDAQVEESIALLSKYKSGTIESPAYGPARNWYSLHWRGNSVEANPTDTVSIQVYGIRSNGNSDLLATVHPAQDTSLAFINANTYPYVKLKMLNTDPIFATPNQLRYWRINADYMPEGAIAPNISFNMKDSVDQGEPINFTVAFKNISPVAFDSLRVKFEVTDRNNNRVVIPIPKKKPLISGDTILVSATIDTRYLPGINTLYVMVNPDNDQPEQYLYNNFIYKDFKVGEDKYNPLLDVTFDGVHILNRDIVSSKPGILVKLKDESRFMALADTALLKVQVRFPDGNLRNYFFGDSMRFTPANLSAGENTASIDFLPSFPDDGEYELIVSGKDVVGNRAGMLEYRVTFTVINTPMISNMLNYPNPFTTSTAFVFTVTGNEVPQNMRIQILTITGKVVREVTKDELGPLHIGRNITDFKWDGTDMYGQKLANGVYLYRVITNLNGKSLDKYKAEGDNTDKFFNKGYGKMYLMR